MLPIIQELKKLSRNLPEKAEPIPLAWPDLGQIGHVSARQGVYVNSAVRRHVRNLLRAEYQAERAAREVSQGVFGAADVLPLMKKISDSKDAIRVIKSMKGLIDSWDNVIAARGNGRYWDTLVSKASQTTVANNWSSFLRTAGTPGAISFGAVPGPAALDSNTTGAWPLPMSLGATDFLYLTNFGQNHLTGTNITMLVDVVQAAGNISTNTTTTTAVSTTTNLRWATGAGLSMTLEITTALGATASNVTITYVDQSGNTAATAAIALQTSGIAARLTPGQDGPMIRLAAGDFGVRSISSMFCSAAMGAGVVAVLLYKPLLLVPTLATTSFAERSTPAQIGGIRTLTDVAQGSKACLGVFVLTSTTSTGIQTYLIETVWG
jgi:hypothetical protein